MSHNVRRQASGALRHKGQMRGCLIARSCSNSTRDCGAVPFRMQEKQGTRELEGWAEYMKTEVVIIGAGPSGLLLSQLLNKAGVSTIVLERASRAHVLSRIRAGLLESGTVEMLRQAGLSARMDVEGIVHDGCYLADDDLMVPINFCPATVSTFRRARLPNLATF